MSTELTIQKELIPVTTKALDYSIETAEHMAPAVEMLSQLNKLNDKITEEKERVTKPLNEALKAERSRWKNAETILASAIDHLRAEMGAFQTAQVKAQRLAEQKIADKVTSGKMSIDKAIDKLNTIDTPDTKVTTVAGAVQFREKQVLKILKPLNIPRKYLVVDEDKVLADLKAGVKIDGAILETIQVPVNYR